MFGKTDTGGKEPRLYGLNGHNATQLVQTTEGGVGVGGA